MRATDLALEKIVTSKNKLEKELYEAKRQLDSQKESAARATADKDEESQTLAELRDSLQIAENQIYENNTAHLKQVKQLRERLDEKHVNQELDEKVDQVQYMQKKLNDQEAELKANRKDLEEYYNRKAVFEELQRTHTDVCKRLAEAQQSLQAVGTDASRLREENERQKMQLRAAKEDLAQLEQKAAGKQRRLDEEIVEGAKVMQERKDLLLKIAKMEALDQESKASAKSTSGLAQDKAQTMERELKEMQQERAREREQAQTEFNQMREQLKDAKRAKQEAEDLLQAKIGELTAQQQRELAGKSQLEVQEMKMQKDTQDQQEIIQELMNVKKKNVQLQEEMEDMRLLKERD